jgi:hypothetical protein
MVHARAFLHSVIVTGSPRHRLGAYLPSSRFDAA